MSSAAFIIAVILAIIVVAILVHRNDRRRQAERAEEYRKAALLRGWRTEFDAEQFHYSGMTEGVPWTFTTDRRGPRHGAEQQRHPSTFQTTAVRSDEVIIAWPKEADAAMRLDVPDAVRAVLFLPLARILGIDVHALATARHDPSLTAALDETKIVAAVLSPSGLRVIFPSTADRPEQIEPLVRLGVKLARTRRPEPVL